MCSRTTPNTSSLKVLNVAPHAFIGCYGVVRCTVVYAGEVKLETCPRPSFHINDFYRYDVMSPSTIYVHATGWGPAKCFQSGPALAKAGPG